MTPRRSRLSMLLLASSLLVFPAAGSAQPLSATWTETFVATGPINRSWMKIAYDGLNEKTVLFGGSASSYLNDLWWYDSSSTSWTMLEPFIDCADTGFVPPAKRDEHVVSYDPDNHRYWIFGGSGFGCKNANRTAQAGTTTTVLVDPTLTGTTPDFYRHWTVDVTGGGRAYVTAYNPATGALTLETPISGLTAGATYKLYRQRGGGTWFYDPLPRTWGSFDGPHWGHTGTTPITRLSPAFAHAPAHRATVMFGGTVYNDTWVLDAVTRSWVPMIPNKAPGSPPALSQLQDSMVYDSVHDVFILFGGLCRSQTGGCPYGQETNETWAYSLPTNTWEKLNPPASPAPRQQHQMAYDPEHGVVVLFGGRQGAGLHDDTWVFSYATRTWTRLFPATSPPTSRLRSMVYDPVQRASIMYRGKSLWTLRLQGEGPGPGPEPNPAPLVSSLAPSSAPAGGPAFVLTIDGDQFVPSSVVRWNGTARPTTYVTRTRLEAAIASADIATAGIAQVTVATPAPGGGTSTALTFTIDGAPPIPGGLTIDNGEPGTTFIGAWCVSSAAGQFGPNSLYSCGSGIDTYRWTPTISEGGAYDVYVWWSAYSTRSTQAPISVVGPGGATTRLFNQRQDGGRWQLHGRYLLEAGTETRVETSDVNGQVAADAVHFEFVAFPELEVILDNAPRGVQDAAGGRTFQGTWCTSGSQNPYGLDSLYSCGGAGDRYRFTPVLSSDGFYDVYVFWTSHPNRSTSVPLTVRHLDGTSTQVVNQRGGGNQWQLHGRYRFGAGNQGHVEVSGANGQAAADAVRFVPVP